MVVVLIVIGILSQRITVTTVCFVKYLRIAAGYAALLDTMTLRIWKKGLREGTMTLSMCEEVFKRAYENTLRFEGGYVNASSDPGGATKYGISQRAYPELKIKDLTEQETYQIYKRDYWNKGKCGEMLEGRPIEFEEVMIKLFDILVNVGVFGGSKIFQRALRSCNRHVEEDGIIGKKTLEAFRGVDDAKMLLSALRSEQASFYRSLPVHLREKYLEGWLRRAYA
jgi:lysozyme family protein